MARDLRYVPPDSLVEITTRTAGGEMLLRPTPEICDTILGVLGRALALYPSIRLHAFIFLMNHYHMLLTASDPETLARFMCFVNGNIARKVSRLLGRSGAFWGRRYSDILVIDEDAAVARLRYLLSNGCKEHLVRSPREWPGPTCVHALLFGEEIRGTWFEQARYSRASRRKATPPAAEFQKSYVVKLDPLPCWSSLDEAERRSRCAQIVDEIEAAGAGQTFVGAERLRQADQATPPPKLERSPEPRCHSSTVERWASFVVAWRERTRTYRSISTEVRAGRLPVSALPEHMLPPPLHWRPDRNIASRSDPARKAPGPDGSGRTELAASS